MAVFSYLDFFSTGVRKVALSTTANMCKKLHSDAADFVMEVVPLLTNLLQYHDAKALEYASICLTQIAEAFASSPDKIDELCNHGLVAQAASLISTSSSGGGQASLGMSTYTGLIRLLSTCASGSSLGAKTLFLLGVGGILKDILSGSGVSSDASVSPALNRPTDQIFEIVNLPNSLKAPKNVPLPDSQKLNGVNGVGANLPKAHEIVKVNGSFTNFSPSPSSITSANSVKEHHMSSVALLDGNGNANHDANLTSDASGTESLKSALKNGNGDDTSKLFDEDLNKAPNGHAVLQVKELLPRGLINSGNLCFFNATIRHTILTHPN